MVAEDESTIDALALPTVQFPLLATSAISSMQCFPIPGWRPRAKRTPEFVEWRRGVVQLAAALGVTEAQLNNMEPPIVRSTPRATRQGEDPVKVEEMREQQHQSQTALAHWQRINTAIYWHVLPSIDIRGVNMRRDRRLIDALVKGQLAHGRELVRWATAHADLSDEISQADLQRTISGAKLKKEATIVQLMEHAEWLHEHWLHLSSTEPSKLQTYLNALVHSMPTENGLMITMLRIWLAGQVRAYAAGGVPEFATFDQTLDAIEAQAALYGIPRGDQNRTVTVRLLTELPEATINLLTLDLQGQCIDAEDSAETVSALRETERGRQSSGGRGRAPGGREGSQSGSRGSAGRQSGAGRQTESFGFGGNTNVSERRPNRSDNDCDNCNSWVCISRKHGGVSACICLHNSRFNINNLPSAVKRYVELARVYEAAHKGENLKGKKFSVASAGASGQSSSTRRVRFGAGPSGAEQRVNALLTLDNVFGPQDDEAMEQWLQQLEQSESLMMLSHDEPALMVIAEEGEHDQDEIGPDAPRLAVLGDDPSADEIYELKRQLAEARAQISEGRANGTPPSAELAASPSSIPSLQTPSVLSVRATAPPTPAQLHTALTAIAPRLPLSASGLFKQQAGDMACCGPPTPTCVVYGDTWHSRE